MEEAISSWLLRAGFELAPHQPLFSLEASEDDRGVFLYMTDRWTIVHYSHLEELEDLIAELGCLAHPILNCWVADSDVWGYELIDQGNVVSAFNSNPLYWGRVEEPRGPNDLFVLCRTLGVSGLEGTIHHLQHHWWYVLFKEQVFRKFAQAMGIMPAASCYRYNEEGEEDFDRPEGMMVKHLWYRRRGRDPMAGFNLHGLDVKPATPERWIHQHVPAYSQEMAEQMQQEMKQRFHLMQLFMLPMRVLMFLMMLPLWAKLLWYRLRGSAPLVSSEPTCPMEGDDIVNVRHDCRLTITGAQARCWQTGISDVLAFDLDGVSVTCTARRPHDVRREMLRLPQGCAFEEQDWWVGAMPVRTIRYSCETEHGRLHVIHHYVQGPRAVYLFSAHPPTEPTVDFLAKLRKIVESMRFGSHPDAATT